MNLKQLLTALIMIISSQIWATDVSMQISGSGAVNDSTIKVGEKVTFDIYFENDTEFKGFSLGFKIKSEDIEKVTHLKDVGNGLNKEGDIKGYNGWENNSVWDLGGIYVIERDWDGNLPDLLGFGGVCKSKVYTPHEKSKKLSFDLMFDREGMVTVDSSFFPPTGKWLFSPPNTSPTWHGPYTFKVVK